MALTNLKNIMADILRANEDTLAAVFWMAMEADVESFVKRHDSSNRVMVVLQNGASGRGQNKVRQ